MLLLAIKITAAITVLFLIVRIYYGARLKHPAARNFSAIFWTLSELYDITSFLPIEKRPNNSNEKRNIQHANAAIGAVYSFFILTVLLFVIYIMI